MFFVNDVFGDEANDESFFHSYSLALSQEADRLPLIGICMAWIVVLAALYPQRRRHGDLKEQHGNWLSRLI